MVDVRTEPFIAAPAGDSEDTSAGTTTIRSVAGDPLGLGTGDTGQHDAHRVNARIRADEFDDDVHRQPWCERSLRRGVEPVVRACRQPLARHRACPVLGPCDVQAVLGEEIDGGTAGSSCRGDGDAHLEHRAGPGAVVHRRRAVEHVRRFAEDCVPPNARSVTSTTSTLRSSRINMPVAVVMALPASRVPVVRPMVGATRAGLREVSAPRSAGSSSSMPSSLPDRTRRCARQRRAAVLPAG